MDLDREARPGKSRKRRLRTFCQKSRYFEDILSPKSRIFDLRRNKDRKIEVGAWKIEYRLCRMEEP